MTLSLFSKGTCSTHHDVQARQDRRVTLLACHLVSVVQAGAALHLASLPTTMQDIGLSRAAAELSTSLYFVGCAAFILPWGMLAGRYGSRVTLWAAAGMFVVSSLLLAVSNSADFFLLLRFVQGVGGGGCAIMGRIAVRDRWQGSQLAKRLSYLSLAFITSLGGSQFLSGLIEVHANWRTGFAAMAGFGALLLIFGRWLPPAPRHAPLPLTEAMCTFGILLRSRSFILPALSGGAGYAAVLVLQEASPFVFLEYYGLSADAFGSIGLLTGGAYFFGAAIVNRYVVRLGYRKLMRLGALVVTTAGWGMLGLYASGGISSSGGMIAFLFLFGLVFFGQAILFPNSMAGATGNSKEWAGQAIALCSFVQQAAAGLAATAAVMFNGYGLWAPAVTVAGLGCIAWSFARQEPEHSES